MLMIISKESADDIVFLDAEDYDKEGVEEFFPEEKYYHMKLDNIANIVSAIGLYLYEEGS